MDYNEFLARKAQYDGRCGFEASWLPGTLFDFQAALVEWATRQGRGAVFADCGLGKTPMQLAWAENVVRRENRPVLVLTPLAVSYQTITEAEKFGIEARRVMDGKARPGINVTNYEKLHLFEPAEFCGVACDESSILKSFDGVRRREITEFMRRMAYRSLWTATAAPNDYVELGTGSEALGHLGHLDMLNRFFKNDQNTIKPVRRWTAQRSGWGSLSAGGDRGKWRFKGHAEIPFWRWVCSWARALRRPSDLGFDDARFVLPPLEEREHVVTANRNAEGMLFPVPALGLKEQREERRRTIRERCEKVAALVEHDNAAIVWCHLNAEGDALAEMIPGARQISGADSDEQKEETFRAFIDGGLRVLVTKAKIAGWGLNLQRCAHVVTFASHSFEQYYQSVRRCWRFGQTRPVIVDVVTTEGERGVMENLRRKAAQADRMFSHLVREMGSGMKIQRSAYGEKSLEVPSWL